MWQTLMDWLPDLSRRQTYEVLRDSLSLGLAALGSYLAYLAIRMGSKQTRLGEEQIAIAQRQGEIAETQHRITQEQLAKRGKIEMFLTGPDVRGSSYVYDAMAVNSGSKTVAGFHWELWVNDLPFVTVLNGVEGAENVGEEFVTLSTGERRRRCTGFYGLPLYEGSLQQFATVVLHVSKALPTTNCQIKVDWIIATDDGSFTGAAPEEMEGFSWIDGKPFGWEERAGGP